MTVNPVFDALTVNGQIAAGGNVVAVVATGSSTARTLQDRFAGTADVRDFGAVGNGTANDTAAFLAAISTGRTVLIPPGTYSVTGPLTITTPGQQIRGYGTNISRLIPIGSSGAGLFVCGTGEPGPDFRDFGIYYSQPDTASRAALTVYPPTFYVLNAPRTRFSNIHIERGTIGIQFAGSGGIGSGGSYIDLFECSCFGTQIIVDQCADTMRFSRLHLWPWGLTANQQSIFTNSSTVGILTQRCDGLMVSDSLFFIGLGVIAQNSTGVLSGPTFGNFTNVGFDNYSGIVTSGAFDLTMASCYFTIGNPTSIAITNNGGTLHVSACRFFANVALSGNRTIIQLAATTVNSTEFVGCIFETASSDNRAIFTANAARLVAAGCTFNADPATAFATARLELTSSVPAVIVGNAASAFTTGTGLAIDSTGAAPILAGNNWQNQGMAQVALNDFSVVNQGGFNAADLSGTSGGRMFVDSGNIGWLGTSNSTGGFRSLLQWQARNNTGGLHCYVPFSFDAISVTSLPSATNLVGCYIHVVGYSTVGVGPLAYSDGTNWRFAATNNVVS